MKQIFLQAYFQMYAYLAKYYIKRHAPFVIGVTGSIWKTSCRMIASEVIQHYVPEKVLYTSSKNFNGELWLSFSILSISSYTPSVLWVVTTFFSALKMSIFWKKKYDIIFLEYGIDHVWEMDFLLSIIQPDIWIVTKIDKVHSSQFSTMDIIASEKYKLLQKSKKVVFLNQDDTYMNQYDATISWEKYYYSTDGNNTSDSHQKFLSVQEPKLLKDNWYIMTQYHFQYQDKISMILKTNLLGIENISYINIWMIITYYIYQHFKLWDFFSQLWETDTLFFTLQPSRFSQFQGISHAILIDSSYNAAPESMKKVIGNFIDMHDQMYLDTKMIFCLWEMRELWDYSQKEHESLAQFFENISWEVYLVWQEMQKYFLPKYPKAKYFQNSELLGEYLKNMLENTSNKYMILFKWSQNTIFMEEALKKILQFPEDTAKICRQENFWIQKKNNFFHQ